MTVSSTPVLLMTNSVAIGGMEEHVRLLARKLDRSRFEVFTVFPDSEPTRAFEAGLRAASDHFDLITPDRRYGMRQQTGEAVRLVRHVRRNRIRVVHLHSTTYSGHVLALLCVRLGGARRVFMTEHLAPEQPVAPRTRHWRNLTMRMLTGVVCVSELNRRRRGVEFHNPPGRTYVVNNGVDIERFGPVDPERSDAARREARLADDAQVVGTAIRLEPGKGVEDLVAGFALVHADRPRSVLLVAGDGSLRVELERQAGELGVTDAVRFVGFQSDPRPFISLMDVFVLPVPFGSASIGLLEAMAMGRACIISFGGEGEAVVPGESGYWAHPNDPASIATYVGKVIDDPVLRDELGAAARRRVESDFSADSVAEALGALYAG